MSFNILNIAERVFIDNSISNYAIHSHIPYSNTTFSKSDEIRLPIQTQDIYTLPSQSTLNIIGRITDKDNKPSEKLSLINNAIAYLFDEIRYELGGIIVDRVRNPGITTTMKGYVSFCDKDCIRYENAGWNHMNNPQIVDSDGNFNVCIPLSMLLGVFEDYKKIIINVRQELILLRSSTDLNSILTKQEQNELKIEPKIELSKIVWRMPHIQVSDQEKLDLMNYIDKGLDLQIAFRGWELHEYPVLQQTTMHTWNVKATNHLEKPRYVIIGFQTNKRNNSSENMSYFDHCNLTNLKLYLNSNTYPYDNLNLNFNKNHFAILYDMYVKFQESYYGKIISEPCLSLANFLKIAPLIVIDCSQQNESLKYGSVDIRLEFETSSNVAAETTAYCLIIHDRLVTYNPLKNIVTLK